MNKKISTFDLHELLELKYRQYNQSSFIENDPISVPHQFTKKEDIEIAAFLTATISWGQRKSIINNANRLMKLMDDSPYDFLLNSKEKDLKKFAGFVHRTFSGTDCRYFIQSLQNIYIKHNGLESAFSKGKDIANAIGAFRNIFFENPCPDRVLKHVSNPAANSAAKRINMFLRWMVRNDKKGVDFGIWKQIKPSHLYCPLDVHTGNVSRKLGLLSRKADDWKAVEELTGKLREFDSSDPVKYDFALFGLGAYENF